jgi:hypothetical protein
MRPKMVLVWGLFLVLQPVLKSQLEATRGNGSLRYLFENYAVVREERF